MIWELLEPHRSDRVGGCEGAHELRLHAPHVEPDADVAAAARASARSVLAHGP